MVLPKEYL